MLTKCSQLSAAAAILLALAMTGCSGGSDNTVVGANTATGAGNGPGDGSKGQPADSFFSSVLAIINTTADNTEPVAIDSIAVTSPDNTEPAAIN